MMWGGGRFRKFLKRLFCYHDVTGENCELNSEFGEKWATVQLTKYFRTLTMELRLLKSTVRTGSITSNTPAIARSCSTITRFVRLTEGSWTCRVMQCTAYGVSLSTLVLSRPECPRQRQGRVACEATTPEDAASSCNSHGVRSIKKRTSVELAVGSIDR